MKKPNKEGGGTKSHDDEDTNNDTKKKRCTVETLDKQGSQKEMAKTSNEATGLGSLLHGYGSSDDEE